MQKKKKTRSQVVGDCAMLARIADERAALLSAIYGRCKVSVDGLETLVLPKGITDALEEIMAMTAPFYTIVRDDEPEEKQEPPKDEHGLVIIK